MTINEDQFRLSVIIMRNKGDKMDREGEFWSEEERQYLQSLFDNGTGITAIAILLQRTELAVIMQANQMDLFTPPSKKRTYRPRVPHCLCRNCKLDPAFCPRNQPPMPMQEVPQC